MTAKQTQFGGCGLVSGLGFKPSLRSGVGPLKLFLGPQASRRSRAGKLKRYELTLWYAAGETPRSQSCVVAASVVRLRQPPIPIVSDLGCTNRPAGAHAKFSSALCTTLFPGTAGPARSRRSSRFMSEIGMRAGARSQESRVFCNFRLRPVPPRLIASDGMYESSLRARNSAAFYTTLLWDRGVLHRCAASSSTSVYGDIMVRGRADACGRGRAVCLQLPSCVYVNTRFRSLRTWDVRIVTAGAREFSSALYTTLYCLDPGSGPARSAEKPSL